MKLLRIRPTRKAGDSVELSKQPAYQLLGIVLRAQLFEASEHPDERSVGIGYRALGKVLALKRETFAMSEEFFAIEVGR